VTDPGQIQAAAESVDALDVLVNNAGIWLYDDLSDPAMLERHLLGWRPRSGVNGSGRRLLGEITRRP
jgi:NAD(P)-dependent dehydrogenase (short-subunit alcohol dehydrogenase family)